VVQLQPAAAAAAAAKAVVLLSLVWPIRPPAWVQLLPPFKWAAYMCLHALAHTWQVVTNQPAEGTYGA